MKPIQFYLRWMILIIGFGIHQHALAAIKVQGIASYEVLSHQGKQMVKVEEEFEANVEQARWLITTRLIKLTPPSNFDQIFCPPMQVAGSDGEDCFYLKTMRVDGTNKLVGWVEPGAVPTYFQSPSIALLWIAYCSGSYLTEQSNSLRPVWAGGTDNKNRQDKCEMAIQIERSTSNPQFLTQLSYICDGRYNPCESKDANSNLMPPPWNNGFTQAVFQTHATAAKSLPIEFRFDLYTHSGPPGGSEIRLRLFSSTSAVVTNVVNDVQISSWLPTIPEGLKIGVKDYRFTTVITNTDTVNYLAIGAWRTTSDREVGNSVRYFATHRSWRELMLETVKGPSRGLFFWGAASLGLILVGACIYFWTLSRK